MSTQSPNTVTMWTVVEWISPAGDRNHRYPKLHGSFVSDQEALKKIAQHRARPGCKKAEMEVLGSYIDANQLAMIAHEMSHTRLGEVLK